MSNTPDSCLKCDKKRPGPKANKMPLDCHGRMITPGRKNCHVPAKTVQPRVKIQIQ